MVREVVLGPAPREAHFSYSQSHVASIRSRHVRDDTQSRVIFACKSHARLRINAGMENPLAKYLRETGLPQAKFAVRGPWRQATVSGWCNTVIPKIADALGIERATGGRVTVQDWAEYAASLDSNTVDRIAAQPQKVNAAGSCGEQTTAEDAA